jgi:hypothetical protein
MQNKRDISLITAYPKSGITYLNHLLFHTIFDIPNEKHNIGSHYIKDIHEHGEKVLNSSSREIYVKSHFPFNKSQTLNNRLHRAVLLVRDPIDVMMSMWDYRHFTGELPSSRLHDTDGLGGYIDNWIRTGGLVYPWAGSWIDHVTSWLNQSEIRVLPVTYEAIKANPSAQLYRILQFFGVTINDDIIERAVDASSVENMRRDHEQTVSAHMAHGAFLQSNFAKPYALGYRFIGRLHTGAKTSILSKTQRHLAEVQFGNTWERALKLSLA